MVPTIKDWCNLAINVASEHLRLSQLENPNPERIEANIACLKPILEVIDHLIAEADLRDLSLIGCSRELEGILISARLGYERRFGRLLNAMERSGEIVI